AQRHALLLVGRRSHRRAVSPGGAAGALLRRAEHPVGRRANEPAGGGIVPVAENRHGCGVRNVAVLRIRVWFDRALLSSDRHGPDPVRGSGELDPGTRSRATVHTRPGAVTPRRLTTAAA